MSDLAIGRQHSQHDHMAQPRSQPEPRSFGCVPFDYCVTITGLTRIPAWAPVTLEVDTFIHAKKRESTSSTGAADVSSGSDFEALTLEICLFDNLTSFPSGLLGRGTLPLTPSIVAGRPQTCYGQKTATSSQVPKRDVSSVQTHKDVALLGPASGMKVASVALCVLFLHGGGANSGAASNLRVLADAEDVAWLGLGCEPPCKVRRPKNIFT